MANLVDILVPDVGGDEVEIIEVCVAVGDEVEAEASIVTVESDKASMDIPIPFDGVIKEISVAVGDKIKEGDLLGKAEEASASTDSKAVEAPEAPKAEPQAATAPADAPAPASSGGSTTVEVMVPDIGDAEGVEIIELLVNVGDSVEEEDGLITLETDKATMDVPAPQAGKVVELKVAVGDKVSEGSLVLVLETASGASGDSSQSAAPVDKPVTDAPVASSASSESKTIEVTVPDIGDASDVEIIDVLVKAGDSVEEEDGLITLETDKATMDVPAPEAGKIVDVKVSVGDKVSEGSLVLTLEVAGAAPVASSPAPTAAAASATASAPAAPAPVAKPAPVTAAPASKGTGKVYASPSVRRVAREFGVDLSLVSGSGRKGRIVKEDVQAYVKAELAKPRGSSASAASGGGGLQVLAQPKVDFSKFGEIEEKPLTRIQKLSGPNLHRNWVTIPHVTQFEEADITELEAFRKQQNAIAEKRKLGVKITPLVFMMKAVADALKAFPTFNTSLSEDGEALIQKKYYHIGIAVDTPGGLVVPVVRDVDKKGIIELSKELMEISVKARDGKLKSQDMQGSCFTISSLGGIGGTAFTPIVNAPDVAILGVSKSEMKPKWDGKEFQPRLMLPLSLSYDHRVIDGALACKFAVHLGDVLSDIRRILL
ncbi:pyruvate dehydrogenase complex dihydrolipoyllysine-residue acetyltransferase [Agaribacter flavus]|uniref:Acetyltransferase component of pyruvate dehydrogenase complex n=1 Tax=Agaribacter flavus TaxID=1902781 RepID=A0ABV7FKU8_9ALTE